MIEVTKEKYRQIKQLNAKQFYKSNLQGKEIKNPVLGNILFTQLGLGETFHRTKRNLRSFICLLKELVETGNCDGKLEPLYKERKDRIIGFYHIKNEIKLSFIKISLDILIGEDQDGKKYYMFKKDPQGNLGEGLTSHREPSGSLNIIIENIEKINPLEQDFKDIKNGQEFWIGDTIKLTVTKENLQENYKDKIFYHGSNSKFDTFDKSKIKENKLGLMFNFTDDYSMAYQYGDNILKVKLNLNNPLTDEDFNHVLTYEEDCLLCDTMGFPKISKERFEQEQSRNKETIGSLFDPFKMKPKFIEFLKRLGYDGIAIPEEHHYGVFEPEQIHVINNVNEQVKEILRTVNEGLEELETNLYATKSVYDIRNLLKNKPKDYRIIEDNNIGYYFIGDGRDYTHYDMLFNAAESGLYADIISNELELREYFENEIDAIKSFYFSVNNTDKDRLDDGYRYRFDYDFGYIYTRYKMLDETELGEVLGTPNDFINIERLNDMNEELKRIKVYPKKKEILDDMEDETGMNIQEEATAGTTAGGTASFSQLGTAPTGPLGVKVNGKPVEGKSAKKKKNEEFEDITISNFNHPFIYGVDIKELQKGIYEVNFVGREENSKDIIPVYIARGVIFDDGEWFTYPITTDYVMNLNKEVKDNIIKRVNNFVHHDTKFDELVRLILSKINNINESFTDNDLNSAEQLLREFIKKMGFNQVQGGVGFNFKKDGNYTHILSYNKYKHENESIITVDYMIFGDDQIMFEKSWEPETIEELQNIISEITNEYEGRE